MEKVSPFSDKDFMSSQLFLKMYTNINNLLINIKSPDYINIKNTIVNIVEQNFPKIPHHSKSHINKDSLFLMTLYKLCHDKIINNPILMKLITNKQIESIKDYETLFTFTLNKEAITLKNNIKKVKDKQKKKTHKEEFTINPASEKEYHELLYNYPDICDSVKQMTIQILSSLSFSGSKTPTTPIKFKHFVSSYIQNQKFMKLTKESLKLDFDYILQIVTEGIIIDFIKMGIVLFPKDNKIQYFINVIEREKYRMTCSNNQEENILSNLSNII